MFISQVDRDEAVTTGRLAVKAALEGHTGEMIIFKRTSDEPYHIDYDLYDLSHIANAESKIPMSMFQDKTRMSEEFRRYLRPLVQGEVALTYENGIAKVANFRKVHVD